MVSRRKTQNFFLVNRFKGDFREILPPPLYSILCIINVSLCFLCYSSGQQMKGGDSRLFYDVSEVSYIKFVHTCLIFD